MFINIDPADGIPIYEQIVRQIKFAAAGGVVRPGELIPSVREVASELAVNPNTVAKAYRQLQIEGVVESVRGRGLQLSGESPEKCREERARLVRLRFRDAIGEARRSRLGNDEIRELIEQELSSETKEASA